MKFLLEFVSRCGCATATAADDDSVNGGVVVVELGPSATSPRSEETRSLVNSQRRYRRRKRGRVGASGCGAASVGGEWRPSLSAIDEDQVFMIEQRRRSDIERTVKRKGSVRDRSYHDDDGRNQFPVMPAFAPTPFMF